MARYFGESNPAETGRWLAAPQKRREKKAKKLGEVEKRPSSGGGTAATRTSTCWPDSRPAAGSPKQTPGGGGRRFFRRATLDAGNFCGWLGTDGRQSVRERRPNRFLANFVEGVGRVFFALCALESGNLGSFFSLAIFEVICGVRELAAAVGRGC